MDDEIDYGELFGVETPGTETGSPSKPSEAGSMGRGGATERQGMAANGRSELSAVRDDEAPETESAPAQEQESASEEDHPAQGQEQAQEEGPSLQSGGSPHRPADGADRRGQFTAQTSGQTPPPAPGSASGDDAKRAIDEVFAQSGMRNPYTGQPITSKAEYDAYRAQFDRERREHILQQTGMSEEEFNQFVQDLPEVRKARETQEAAEKAERAAREAAARVKMDEQLREIGALNPSIRSLEDLAKMPTYPRFYELVRRGNTLTDAFKLANYEALTQSAAAGARQAAVNAARSKGHLEQTRSRGTGAVSVPAEVREQYKLFNPDATDEEIQRHYARSVKPS